MPRGRTLKTKKREAYWLAKAAEAGRLQAQREHLKKLDLDYNIKDTLKEWLKKIDPLELIAIAGGTIAVHDILFKADSFINEVSAWKDSDKIQTQIFARLGFLGFEGGLVLEILKSILPEDKFNEAFGEKPPEVTPSITSDLMLWVIAFGISYFAVRHGGDLLSTARMFWGAKLP